MIALVYDNATQAADFVRDGGNLQSDDTLETVVLISLFTRRRANDDDQLPDAQDTNRQGWWADTYADVEGDRIGSRLWLLRRSKTTQSTLNLARAYIEEALQWLVDDGIAESVTVAVERHDAGMLAFKVELLKPTEPASRWAGVWEAHLAEL